MSNPEDEWNIVANKKNKAPPKADQNVTILQDWNKVVINGTAAKSTIPHRYTNPNVNISPEAIKMRKIEEGEITKLKCLSIDARQELIKARVEKKYNQEKLAQALSMPANLYKDIENGKTIPQQNILSKINHFLGTHAKLT
jgi:ribosome-binding protein aMBF1 (putative translation factor)